MAYLLCLDADPSVADGLRRALESMGHEILRVGDVPAAMAEFSSARPDALLVDVDQYVALCAAFREQDPAADCRNLPLILLADHERALHAQLPASLPGKQPLLTKPLRAEAVRLAVGSTLEGQRLREEREHYRRELLLRTAPRPIIGESAALRATLDAVASVAPTRATVLLQGESGTGKELFARALHDASPRREYPFVTVNCAALPEGLVESVLFGHERGSFTGAHATSMGSFQQAHRGTLFLDEISEMRLEAQSKLLRALQEHEITRVGGSRPIEVDVRIVVATNRNLEAEITAKRFREDLFYRLSVVPIRIPPLRERPEDVPLLVEYFVDRYAKEVGIPAPTVSQDALAWLRQQPWPGNVRELENVIQRGVIFSRQERISADHLIALYGEKNPQPPEEVPLPSPDHIFELREIERSTIERALTATSGHRRNAAKLLGISERTLRNKLRIMREKSKTSS